MNEEVQVKPIVLVYDPTVKYDVEETLAEMGKLDIGKGMSVVKVAPEYGDQLYGVKQSTIIPSLFLLALQMGTLTPAIYLLSAKSLLVGINLQPFVGKIEWVFSKGIMSGDPAVKAQLRSRFNRYPGYGNQHESRIHRIPIVPKITQPTRESIDMAINKHIADKIRNAGLHKVLVLFQPNDPLNQVIDSIRKNYSGVHFVTSFMSIPDSVKGSIEEECLSYVEDALSSIGNGVSDRLIFLYVPQYVSLQGLYQKFIDMGITSVLGTNSLLQKQILVSATTLTQIKRHINILINGSWIDKCPLHTFSSVKGKRFFIQGRIEECGPTFQAYARIESPTPGVLVAVEDESNMRISLIDRWFVENSMGMKIEWFSYV